MYLGEFILTCRFAARHIDKRTVRENDIGGHALILRELQPQFPQSTEQLRINVLQLCVGGKILHPSPGGAGFLLSRQGLQQQTRQRL